MGLPTRGLAGPCCRYFMHLPVVPSIGSIGWNPLRISQFPPSSLPVPSQLPPIDPHQSTTNTQRMILVRGKATRLEALGLAYYALARGLRLLSATRSNLESTRRGVSPPGLAPKLQILTQLGPIPHSSPDIHKSIPYLGILLSASRSFCSCPS
jgi:hypothetical protein